MIARTWRGRPAEDAAEYAEYIRTTGTPSTRPRPATGGLPPVPVEGDRAEFLTLSLWESLDSIRAFAGEDVERAVFYPEDDLYLIERDLVARHYVVAGVAHPSDGPVVG
jgi:hypothetical protein